MSSFVAGDIQYGRQLKHTGCWWQRHTREAYERDFRQNGPQRRRSSIKGRIYSRMYGRWIPMSDAHSRSGNGLKDFHFFLVSFFCIEWEVCHFREDLAPKWWDNNEMTNTRSNHHLLRSRMCVFLLSWHSAVRQLNSLCIGIFSLWWRHTFVARRPRSRRRGIDKIHLHGTAYDATNKHCKFLASITSSVSPVWTSVRGSWMNNNAVCRWVFTIWTHCEL